MSTIATRLAEVRRGTGLGVRGFAAALEERAGYSVSHTSVSQYEGGTTVPAAYLEAVSRTFRVNPAWLLTGDGLPESVDATAAEGAVAEIARIVGQLHPRPVSAEAQSETFFRLSPDPFCILTPDGYCTRLNAAWEGCLGYRPEELLERRLFDFLHPEDVQATRAALAGARLGPEAVRFENRIRDAAGRYRSFAWHATHAEGLVFAVVRDMRDLGRTQDALRRLSSALEHAGDPVMIVDLGGVIEYVNPAFERGTGYGREEVVGRPAGILKSGLHDPSFYGRLWETLRGGEVFRGEIINRKKGGDLIYEDVTIAPVRDEGGAVTRYVALGRDITARKAAEERRLQRQASLATAQRIARLGDWEWRIGEEVVHWSEEAFRVFGLTPAELGTRSGALLQSVHPEDRQGVERAMEAAIEQRTPFSLEHRIVRPGGEVRIVHQRAEVVLDAEGRPTVLRGTVQDITEWKRIEHDLRRKDAVLEAVAYAAEQLARHRDWTEAVPGVLNRLGSAAEVDSIQLVELVHPGVGRRLPDGRAAWWVGDVEPAAGGSLVREEGLRPIGLGRWEDLLRLGHLIQGRAVEFPERERAVLEALGIDSLLVVPVFMRTEWWGVLLFLDHGERHWTVAEVEALKTAAVVVGAAIQREIFEASSRRLATDRAARGEGGVMRERAAEILEGISDALLELDESCRIVGVNRQGEVLLGRPRRDLIAEMVWDAFPHAEDSAVYRACQRVQAERVATSEEEYYAPLGRWFELHIFPTSAGVSMVIHDIRRRKEAEESLRASEAKYAGIVSIAADAIISIDGAQRIILFNRGAEEIFGYAAEEVLGQPLATLIPERFRAAHSGHVLSFRAASTPARFMGERSEIFGLRKNGEEFAAEATISKLEVSGEMLMTVVLRDVTEYRRRDFELRRRNSLLALLRSVTIAANELPALDDAARVGVREVCAMMGWPVGHAYRLERGGRLVPLRTWHAADPRHLSIRTRLEAVANSKAATAAARAVAGLRPTWLPLAEDPRFTAGDLPMAGIVAVPVLSGSSVTAVLEFLTGEDRSPDGLVLDILAQIGIQLGRVAERQETEAGPGRARGSGPKRHRE